MRKTSTCKTSPIDQLPLIELEGRYGLGKTGINYRLNRLRIKPVKAGRRSFISAAQLEVLDRLHEHITAGGTIQGFISKQASLGQSNEEIAPGHEISADVSQQQAIAALVNAIAALNMPVTIQIGTGVDRFAYYRFLDEAAKNGWELTTSEVAELLKIPVAEIQESGQSFRQAGFVFNRCEATGKWEGRWRVVEARN